MSSLPSRPLDVALLGAGRVGTAVAALLSTKGMRITGVGSRTGRSAERAARFLGTSAFDLTDPVDADIFLIGTPMEAIEPVVAALAERVHLGDATVVHLAGAVGVEVLEPARRAGAAACALHPVQACPDVDAAMRNLPGSTWGVTTSRGAERWARDLVELLDGTPVEVAERDRPLWHAAAVVTSNGIAALLAAGERILEQIGVGEPELVLGPLARGTLENARVGGGGARTLTGPVVRAEMDVIRAHIASLAVADDLAELYRSISLLIADAAVSIGRLDHSAAEELRRALEQRE